MAQHEQAILDVQRINSPTNQAPKEMAGGDILTDPKLALSSVHANAVAKASRGFTSTDILVISPATYEEFRSGGTPPAFFSKDQLAVINEIKKEGMEPKFVVERTNDMDQFSWVLRADWRDKDCPELHRLNEAAAAGQRATRERQDMQEAMGVVDRLPAIEAEAKAEGKAEFGVLVVDTNDTGNKPPELTYPQQYVFDALQAAGLQPSLERGYPFEIVTGKGPDLSEESQLSPSVEPWLIKATSH